MISLRQPLLKTCLGLGILLSLLMQNQTQAQSVPLVPNAKAQAMDFDSPVWNKALPYEGFDLATGSEDDRKVLEQTTVKVMHDGEMLYILYTAMDSQISKLKYDKLDEFADLFPQGDHGQLTVNNDYVFAFGPQGNHYDAYYLDRDYFTGFQVKSRINKDSWQTILVIDLKSFSKAQATKSTALSMVFTRHIDRGMPTPQRSFLTAPRAALDQETR